MSSITLLGLSGSLRRQSTNSGLLRAARALSPQDVIFDIADISDVPFFNADITEKPASVLRVFEQMRRATAFVFACPEYNYSIAPALKNMIDWASREPNNALLAGKAVALLSAAGGMGGSRAQYHFRQVCVYLDLHVLNKPEFFSNAFAGGFDANGDLVDEKLRNLLAEQVRALVEFSRRIEG